MFKSLMQCRYFCLFLLVPLFLIAFFLQYWGFSFGDDWIHFTSVSSRNLPSLVTVAADSPFNVVLESPEGSRIYSESSRFSYLGYRNMAQLRFESVESRLFINGEDTGQLIANNSVNVTNNGALSRGIGKNPVAFVKSRCVFYWGDNIRSK